jgi:hypothetical protein
MSRIAFPEDMNCLKILLNGKLVGTYPAWKKYIRLPQDLEKIEADIVAKEEIKRTEAEELAKKKDFIFGLVDQARARKAAGLGA